VRPAVLRVAATGARAPWSARSRRSPPASPCRSRRRRACRRRSGRRC